MSSGRASMDEKCVIGLKLEDAAAPVPDREARMK